jgi:(p)ppGpp synthase/HD superfamily hydrolase
MTTKFSKLYIALKFRLQGMRFFDALIALEKGREIHNGWRKDGKTPEYQHQLEIALYILTLKDVEQLEKAIICALLHDTMEDYAELVSEMWISEKFGSDVLLSLRRLNKHVWKDYNEYFSELAQDINASLVKLGDRVNNFQSMNRGKFTMEKQAKYAEEVMVYFLPMAKKARKNFPRQMDAYYNVETMLKSQYELIQLLIEANKKV